MKIVGIKKDIEINGNILEVEELPAELPKAPEPIPKGPPTYSLVMKEYKDKPVCFYYWLNKWRVKEILVDNDTYYHLIGRFVYTTDGRMYMGYYYPDNADCIDEIAMDPDEITRCCCPCFLKKNDEYFEKKRNDAVIKYVDGKRVY